MLRSFLATIVVLFNVISSFAQIGPPYGGGSSPIPPNPSCSQAADYRARNPGLDYLSIVNSQNLICGLVSDGTFCGSYFDAIYLTAINNINSALSNVCGVQYTATLIGSPSFIPNNGFSNTTGSTSVGISTNFVPSNAIGSAYTSNVAHVSTWSFSETLDSNPSLSTSSAVSQPGYTAVYPSRGTNVAGTTYCRLNDAVQITTGVFTNDPSGWTLCNRTGASTNQIYRNTTLLGSPNVTAGGLPTTPISFALSISGFTNGGIGTRIAIVTIGGDLTPVMSSVYARFCTYLIAQRGSCTTTVPSVALTSPVGGATLTGQVTLTTSVASPGGIASLQYKADGLPIGAPFSCTGTCELSWNSASFIDGSHTLTAVATDNAGNTTTSASINVTTSNGVNPNTYYFAAAGSDSGNPCTVQASPCQTQAKASSLVYGQGDSLLYNGGDTFDGCLVLNQSNVKGTVAAHPLTISLYGTGTPTLTSNCTATGTSGAIDIDGLGGIHILGPMNIRPGAIMTRGGIYIYNDTGTQANSIIVENVDVGGFGVYGSTGANYGGEVMFDGSESAAGLANVTLLNTTLHGLSGATSTDDNGATNFGNGTNILNVVSQGNLVFNIGGSSGTASPGGIGNGIVFNNVGTGTHTYNLVHDIGANTRTCGGPAGLWWGGPSTNLTTQFSEMYNIQHLGSLGASTVCDWDCADFDNGNSGAVGQYLYCHHSDGPAFLAFDASNVSFRYSIAEATNALLHAGVADIATSGIVNFYNLTIWLNTQGSANVRAAGFEFDFGVTASNTGVAANNIFAVNANDLNQVLFVSENYTSPSSTGPTGYLFANNDWYNISGFGTTTWKPGSTSYTSLVAWQASVSGRDPNATTTNPLLTSGGSGGTCSWTPSTQSPVWPPGGCPTAYTLQGGSLMRGTGVDLTHSPYAAIVGNIGTRDYYANAIPEGGNYNIGAYGVYP